MRRFLPLLLFALPFSAAESPAQRPHRDLVWNLPPWILADPSRRTDPLLEKGYLDVLHYDGWNGNPVDPTGTRDSTLAIQKAIEDARVHTLVLLFPPGTYLVSNTLSAGQRAISYQGKLRGTFTVNTVLMGKPGAPRPVLKLRDSAPGFGKAAVLKPLVHLWAEDPNNPVKGAPRPNEGNASGFNQVFRGIDLDLGKGNPGAVGIFFAAAEGSVLEDVTIRAAGAAIGVMGLPGRGMTTRNLRVVGGRIGIRAYTTPSPVLIGIRLEFQEQAALELGTWTPVTMIGFSIVKNKGPAVTLPASNTANAGHLALLDGSIRLIGGGPAIDDRADRNLYLENVYFQGASPLVLRKSGEPLPSAGTGWNRVPRFVNSSRLVLRGHRFARLEEHDSIPPLDEPYPAPPPSDLISRHLPPPLPDPFREAVDVRSLGAAGDGTTDDTAAIQAAIDSHPVIFLPKGDYVVSKTLVLHPETVLFGIAKNLARLQVAPGWRPVRETPILLTDEAPDGRTMLADLRVEYPLDQPAYDYFNVLTWRAGRASVVRDIQDGFQTWTRSSGTNPHALYRVQGGGGGRWYGWHSSRFLRNRHAGFRILVVEGTKEPLTFYGFEPQDSFFGRKNPQGLLATPFNEIRNARNVRILGSKSESAQAYLAILGSANVFFLGHGGHAQTKSGAALFEVDQTSRNVLLWALGLSEASYPYVTGSDTLRVHTRSKGILRVGANDLVGFYIRGVPDSSAWR